ncbi:MAG TPA: hypothetical protein VE153_22635, partial [Myxococcus sp.]|nr:hypothetical protein [Myxococcus sp.]
MAPDLFDVMPEFELGPRDEAGVAIMKSIQALPGDTDPGPSARALLGLLDDFEHGGAILGRNCRKLPVSIIHAVLAGLEGATRPHAVFLRVCLQHHLEDRGPTAAWERALGYLLAVEDCLPLPVWRSDDQLKLLASYPAILQAVQTAAVVSERITRTMADILFHEGSEASLDAVIAQVERAVQAGDERLDEIQRACTSAFSSPVAQAVSPRIYAALKEREARSPALRLGRELGFGPLEHFWFDATIKSSASKARYEVSLGVASRKVSWLEVLTKEHLNAQGEYRWQLSYFDGTVCHQDDLGLGTCTPEELPQWLARAAARLQVQWDFRTMHVSTSLD